VLCAGSLFHQILEQRDMSAANTSADSLGSELFDARTMQRDDRPQYLSFSTSVL